MEQAGKADGWTKLAIFEYYGFSVVGKYFAFIAGPSLALLLFNRRLSERIYRALTSRDIFSPVSWIILVSIFYGIAEVIYGVMAGYSLATAFQILVFNLCPIYLFLGIWAGACKPNLLRNIIRINAWYSAVYVILYFTVLRNINSDLVSEPGDGSAVLLGLFCFESNLVAFWLPILVASFSTIASQIRADWAGFGMALMIWALAAKKVGRVAIIALIMLLLLTVSFIFNLEVPGLPGRGGTISARDTIGRAMSSFNPTLAREYTSDAAIYAGTVQWRETWWKEIRSTVYESPATTVFGMGYGYPIADLVPYLKGSELRTPHSIFYFTLCYSGYVGVTLFGLLQVSIAILHWKTFKITGQIFGLVFQVSVLTSAFFGNFFEAPQAAIPTYLMFGMAMGPLFTQQAESNLSLSKKAIWSDFATSRQGWRIPSR